MRNSLICIFLSVFGLLACTEADDLTFRDADGVVVSFTTPGMTTGDVNTRAVSTYVPLDENTTVRILVYRRTGATADMATDTYIGENTYAANAFGALVACAVDSDGKINPDGTVKDLRLIQGNYDFYAITPALPVTKEASNNARKVSVNHGADYATSLTQQGVITTTSGAITLDVLDRKCSKLEFVFDRKSTNVSKIEIEEVVLTSMSDAPLVGMLAQNLPDASAWTTEIKMSGDEFKVDATNPWQATGDRILLPKPVGDFTVGMKLKFNGFTNVITLAPATISGLALAQGYRYVFKVTLKGGSIKLTLTVANWSETYNVNADNLGASNSVTINVGKWNNVDFDSSTGGSDNVTIGNWTGSVDWDEAMGEYPELSGTTIDGSTLWGEDNNSNSSTGGQDNVDNGDWGNSSNTNPGEIGR